jgi:hypothetical protein
VQVHGDKTNHFLLTILLRLSIRTHPANALDNPNIDLISPENFLENAIKNVKEIKNARYSIFELSKTDLNICSLALSHTTGIHFHNISKVQKIYSHVLGIELQLDISKVCKITSLRHDIVHRNGYTTDGKLIELDAQDFFQTLDIL